MRYAIIENQLVVNVVVADNEAFAISQGWIPCPNNVGPGYNYIEGEWIPPVIELSQPVPVVVTKQDLLVQIQALQQQIENLPAE
jgi:hypothetical protein